MFRARGVYHRRRRHRYQSSSDDDSSSSSSSASSSSSHFSDDDEEIDVESISSSSSSLSAASASAVDGEDLVQEMTLSSDSEASDDEDYAVRDSRGEVIPGSLKMRSLHTEERCDLLSSSSSSEQDSSDSDSDSEDGLAIPIQTGSAINERIESHSRFVFRREDFETQHLALSTSTSNTLNRPLSPWRNSSSKKRIIDDLKNDQSFIHSIAREWEKNIDILWEEYARQYQRSRFKGYMKTIMTNFHAKKGPFEVTTSNVPTLSTPWEESSSRKRIIDDLKNHKSPIHELVKDWRKNLGCIWKEYAPEYQRSKFKGYLETIIHNFTAKKGPFKDRWYKKKDGVPSRGYSLLYQLMMNSDIDNLPIAQVHTSHPLFEAYPLADFKQKYKNMKDLTDKLKPRLKNYSEKLDAHFTSWGRAGPKTNRGEFFWDEHAACRFLEKDIKEGARNEMTVEELWSSRPEYQEFSKDIFRKHVYQESSKQRCGTYWQVKRNRKGQKKHNKDVRRLRSEFRGNIDEEVNNLANELAQRWHPMTRSDEDLL